MNHNKQNNNPNHDFLHEQIINISKAGAFDIVSKQVGELTEQNNNFRNALNAILDEFKKTDASEIVNNPAELITNIGRICLTTLKQNQPL